jgi:hypothetical protein
MIIANDAALIAARFFLWLAAFIMVATAGKVAVLNSELRA